jgi:hypothetical protein
MDRTKWIYFFIAKSNNNKCGTNASGSYSVTATINGCTGAVGISSVIVNQIPPSPSVSSNGHYVQAQH